MAMEKALDELTNQQQHFILYACAAGVYLSEGRHPIIPLFHHPNPFIFACPECSNAANLRLNGVKKSVYW
jgi:hypothetical protein